MRSTGRTFYVGGTVVTLVLVLAASVGVARTEVGGVWPPEQPAPWVVGYKLLAIGDDPEPVPTVWSRFSPPDSGRAVLNPEGDANGDGMPSMLVNPNTGSLVVAWSRNSASGFDVVISRFEGGGWGAPQVVAGTQANELDPQLVLDPAGNLHLFYWIDGASPQVFHTQAPPGLSPWSAPVLVSQPGQAACRPAGVMHEGTLRVVYEVHDFGFGNTPREVVLARLEDGVFVPEVVSVTGNLGDVRPQVHAHAGRLWVDWIDAETTGGLGEVAWTRLNAQGLWESIRYEAFATPEQRDFLVRGGVRMKAIE